jgi:peptidoglycan-N-acetylglucosamine deacetylase
MRHILPVIGLILLSSSAAPAPCENPNALGVSRQIAVAATEYPEIGLMQYRRTLPLAEREVVLTFDDGPLPPYTTQVLRTLAAECVKATFFLVGHQAKAHPELVRLIYNSGHTIGTHSQNHPLTFDQISLAQMEREIDDGIASVTEALGEGKSLAPFFRIPGLARTRAVEASLQARSLSVWSADVTADDWKKITSSEVLYHALARLEARGKGVLLLHDIQPRTALMLPILLTELKQRGFKIVHVVAGDDTMVASVPAIPANSAVAKAAKTGRSRSAGVSANLSAGGLFPATMHFPVLDLHRVY